MTGTIKALDNFHTNSYEDQEKCTSKNAFTLEPSESLAFPLFTMETENGKKVIKRKPLSRGTTFTIKGADGNPTPSLAIGATVKSDNGSHHVV
ncbi:MAG: hypothetical protein CSA81_13615 [Acidobacteria bacterium]|nr:MAG: hypothetical protein CSA81_13615 [Acidobacteriota bacterium]